MKRRLGRTVAAMLMAGFLVGGVLAETAQACPLCRAAAEEDDALAKAYMYSILFMLAVPGVIFSGLTAGLIRLGYKEARAMKEYELEEAGSEQTPRGETAPQEQELMKV